MHRIGWRFMDTLNKVHQRAAVPAVVVDAHEPLVGRLMVDNRPSLDAYRREKRMATHFGIPVFGIAKIPFPAVHDRVPETSRSGVDRLRNLMAAIQKIVPEP